LNLLKSGTVQPEDLTSALQKLSDQAQRAGTIVHRVHDFVRKRSVTPEHRDLRKILQDATSFISTDMTRGGGRIDMKLPDAPVPVRADAVLIQQVLLNLMRN